MANGASTALFQQALSMLLQGRQPSPLAPATLPSIAAPSISAPIPAGGFAPPGGFLPTPMGPAPEPAPVAPLPARDESLIEQLTGPRPVAPVTQPDSLLQKIALALQGFGAGTQGYGPQFLAGLREERERPQREFRAATEAFEANRRRAVEIAEDKRQRERGEIQRRADIQSDREFDMWVRRTGVEDQKALEQLRQTFELERDARRAQAERLEQERRETVQRRRDAGLIARDAAKLGASPQLAKEIGEYWSGLRESLSPAAAKFESTQARLAEMRLRRDSLGVGGRASSSNAALKAAQEVEAAKGALISLQQRGGDPRQERAIRTRIDRAIGRLRSFPGQLEGGLDSGGWPWVKIWDGQKFVGIVPDSAPAPGPQQPQQQMTFDLNASQQPQRPTRTMAQIRAAASAAGISEAEAIQRAQAAGFTITQ